MTLKEPMLLPSAYLLYKKIRKGDILITKLREEIVKGLLNHENVEENTSERRRVPIISGRWKDPVRLEESIVKGVIRRSWKETGKKKGLESNQLL
jgi:hypothetical protein